MPVLRVPIEIVDAVDVLLVAELLAATPDAGGDVLLPVPGDVELPHAASTAATPARTGAARHRLRISDLRSSPIVRPYPLIT
ncbi:MAG TPA: hypothetical protein VME44_17965 [Streptosporangiaceae bacterium]|nr:hypothetical protein [Streptosporangiaceae bacterium]